MRPIEETMTRILRGHLFALSLFVIGLIFFFSGKSLLPSEGLTTLGFAGSFPVLTASSMFLTILASFSLIVLIVLLMLLMNRFLNLVRTNSKLYVGLFVLMVAVCPGVSGMSLNALVMAFVVMFSLMMMYTTYQRKIPTRRIFLVFVLMSFGASMQWSYAAFFLAFFLCCGQMRCLSMRSLLAVIVGILTPPWILWGFGYISLDSILMPKLLPPSAAVFAGFSPAALVAIITTLVAAVCITGYNTIRIFGLNARTRAFNGVFATITLWTALISIIDFGHALDYFPLLAALTAMQSTLFFRICIENRSYIYILAMMISYITAFALI